MKDAIIKILSTGLGLGYTPVAPGTFGTVLGSALFFLFRHQSQLWLIKFSVVFAVFAFFVAHKAEKVFKQKDCQKIVIDEVAGVLFCYMFVSYSVFNLVLGFVLFRLFDIAKIFPANWAQNKLKGGWGVVGDDLIAGLQAGILLFFMPNIVGYIDGLLKSFL